MQHYNGGSDGKESACSDGDLSSIPGLGRYPEEGNGSLLQYSCLEIPWTKELQFTWGLKESDTTEWLTCSVSLWDKAWLSRMLYFVGWSFKMWHFNWALFNQKESAICIPVGREFRAKGTASKGGTEGGTDPRLVTLLLPFPSVNAQAATPPASDVLKSSDRRAPPQLHLQTDCPFSC